MGFRVNLQTFKKALDGFWVVFETIEYVAEVVVKYIACLF